MNNIKIDNKMSKSGTSEKFIFIPSYYFIITKPYTHDTSLKYEYATNDNNNTPAYGVFR